jgi:D-glycero-D-manno-heptose 1,7-bisphosphate phosphatase
LNSRYPILFLDRDGTIIEDVHYLSDPQHISIIDGAVDALLMFQQNGYLLIVVTNQSGVSRGYFDIQSVIEVNLALDRLLHKYGVYIHSWHFCPHGPLDNCSCRKPKTGLLKEATTNIRVDHHRSLMIGDKTSDLIAGANFGIESWLISPCAHLGQPYSANPLCKSSSSLLNIAKSKFTNSATS